MRRCGNAFLILFLVDALLSVLDDQLKLWAGAEMLGPLREAVALLVFLAAFPMYWLLAVTPRLPKSVFLPLTLFFAWITLGAMPLPIYAGLFDGLYWASLCQLTLAVFALLRVRALTGGAWLLGEGSLWGPEFSLGHSLRFVAASLILGPVAVVAYLVLSAALAVNVATGGFVRVAPDGVYVQEREYRRVDRTVHLVGMIHIGDQGFYEEVFQSLPSDETVILAEGVSDEGRLLSAPISYKSLAAVLHLDAQEETPLPVDTHEVVHADIDTGDLSPETVALLNRVGGVLARETPRESLLAMLELQMDSPSVSAVRRMWEELLDLRNEHALRVLSLQLEDYPTALLAWGAAHMPGLEAGVRAAGFERVAMRERRIIEF
jgi:hypothetical protein